MWMITGKTEGARYTSLLGIFKDFEKVEEYLSSNLIDDYFSSPIDVDIQAIPAVEYPIFVIWDFNQDCYTYADIDMLSDRLFHIEKLEDEDDQHFILDIFKEDYQAIHPGEEYFKFINHTHVENGTVEGLIKKGLRVLALDGLEGNYNCRECSRKTKGVLTRKGYEPPQGWQIIEESPDELVAVCSENCKNLILAEADEF